jgi:CDP-2,3-bis-(O-geranylgeranyl)-sn-glycerol synthase
MLKLLLLVLVANSAPVLLADALSKRWSQPIDGGLRLRDGRPLFGASKTWRGLIAAAACTGIAAVAIGVGWRTGVIAGLLAMLGDLLASFTKRRIGYAAGDRCRALDAIPESLLPALALRSTLGLDWLDVLLLPLLFAAIVRFASPLLYRLHVRQRPW